MADNTSTSIKINGVTYNVNIIDLDINGEFLYKYANRVSNGDFKSEAIGYFENQLITFKGDQDSDFVELYRELAREKADGTFNVSIEVFSPLGKYVFDMYPNKLSVKLRHIDKKGQNWWGEMPVRFIAGSKREVPNA